MKSKMKSVTRKDANLLAADRSKPKPVRDLDLKIPDRISAINAIIDKIEAKKIAVSSSELRIIASDKLTQMVREERFILKLCKLIYKETTIKLFIDDDTQPKVESFAYQAIREILWRTADKVGAEEAGDIMESVMDIVDMEFG